MIRVVIAFEQVLRGFVDHYNREKPHRALGLLPPRRDGEPEPSGSGAIHRRDRIGGLVHEYYRAAA
jgi:putative transposase